MWRSETQNLHFVFMPRALQGEQIARYSVTSINSLWTVAAVGRTYDAAVRIKHVIRLHVGCWMLDVGCWMLSAGANPAFIATQMGHENAQRVYTVYSAWIHALGGDQIAFINKRIDEYNSAPIVPLTVKPV